MHRALRECFDVPERDRFQILTTHPAERVIFDSAYLGVERSAAIVFIQVILSAGRSTEQKQSFYARVAELLAESAHIRPEDVTIVLVENTRTDWSFGNGVAQYVTMPRDQWK